MFSITFKAKLLLVLALAGIFQLPAPISAHAQISQAIQNGSWTIESSSSDATVSWTLPSSSRVELYREGHLTNQDFGSGKYQVGPVRPGENLNFEIKVISPLDEKLFSKIDAKTDLTFDQAKKLYEHTQGAGLTLRVPNFGENAQVNAQAASGLPDYTVMRYQTFIPESSVPAPALGVCSEIDAEYRFLGDSRSFSATSSSFRTRFDVRVNWVNNSAISPTRTVGITTRERRSSATSPWQFDGTMMGSNDTMSLTILTAATSNHAHFRIRQDVKNPYCWNFLTNGIFADFEVSIWRAGSYSFEGTFLKAPSHEMYLKDQDNTSWEVLMQSPTLSMNCLIPIVSGLGCNASDAGVGVR